MPVRRNWEGRPTAEWEPKWKSKASKWGASKWKAQAQSTWVGPQAPEPCAPQAAMKPRDVCQGQVISKSSASPELFDSEPVNYWDRQRQRQTEETTKDTPHYASRHDNRESDEESEISIEGDKDEKVLHDTPFTGACKKGDDIDDASTQAGTTSTSRSVAAESCGEGTQPDDERYKHALDDAGLSDAESSTSSGAVGGTEEDEIDAEKMACLNENTAPCESKQKASERNSEHIPVVVSPGSWAAKQRLRQMERERAGTCAGTCAVAVEIMEAPQLDSQTASALISSEHDRKGAKALESSPGSWAAQVRRRRAENEANKPEQLSPEEIARKAKSILNKLTDERFESLCRQICALPVHTPEQLAALVAEIFDKATTEKGFLTLYTEICERLDAHLSAEGSCVGGKVFRKALVTECQASFERNLQQPLDLKTLDHLSYEERYVEEVKHKTRTLGNMRFIGELLVRKLLAGKILFFIVNEMLDINSEASLESLIELLTIVSPALEKKGTIYEAPLREMFASLKKRSKDKKLSMRIRCKMNDLLDLRANGWVGKAAITTLSSDQAKAATSARKR